MSADLFSFISDFKSRLNNNPNVTEQDKAMVFEDIKNITLDHMKMVEETKMLIYAYDLIFNGVSKIFPKTEIIQNIIAQNKKPPAIINKLRRFILGVPSKLSAIPEEKKDESAYPFQEYDLNISKLNQVVDNYQLEYVKSFNVYENITTINHSCLCIKGIANPKLLGCGVDSCAFEIAYNSKSAILKITRLNAPNSNKYNSAASKFKQTLQINSILEKFNICPKIYLACICLANSNMMIGCTITQKLNITIESLIHGYCYTYIKLFNQHNQDYKHQIPVKYLTMCVNKLYNICKKVRDYGKIAYDNKISIYDVYYNSGNVMLMDKNNDDLNNNIYFIDMGHCSFLEGNNISKTTENTPQKNYVDVSVYIREFYISLINSNNIGSYIVNDIKEQIQDIYADLNRTNNYQPSEFYYIQHMPDHIVKRSENQEFLKEMKKDGYYPNIEVQSNSPAANSDNSDNSGNSGNPSDGYLR